MSLAPAEPMATGFPYSRSIVTLRSHRTVVKSGRQSIEDRYYLSSQVSNPPSMGTLVGLLRHLLQNRRTSEDVRVRDCRLFFGEIFTMYIEALGHHLAVCSAAELAGTLRRDAGFWNVISMREPGLPQPVGLQQVRRKLELIFDDVTDPTMAASRPPEATHLSRAFAFVDEAPGQPILVQCRMGDLPKHCRGAGTLDSR